MGGCLIPAQAQACVDKVQSVPRDTDLRGQRRGVFLKSNTAGFPPLQSLLRCSQHRQRLVSGSEVYAAVNI